MALDLESDLREPDTPAPPAPPRVGVIRHLRAWAGNHPLLVVGGVAFLVRALACAYVQIRYDGAVFGDELMYSSMAHQTAISANHTWDEWTKTLFNNTATFMWPLTAVYWLTGSNGYLGQLVPAAFGTATAIFTTALLRPVCSRRWAIAGGLFVALLPSQILWSSLTMKDSAVWAVLAALAVLVARLATESSKRLVAITVSVVVLLFLLGHLREHTMVIASWAIVVTAALAPGKRRWARFGWALLVALALPWVLGFGGGGSTLVSGTDTLGERRATNAQGAETALVMPLDSDAATSAAAAGQAKETVEQAQSESEAASADVLAAAEMYRVLQEARAEAAALRRAQRALAAAQAEAVLTDRLAAERQIEYQQAVDAADAAAKQAFRADIDSSFGESYQLPEEGLVANLRYLPRGLSVMLLWPYPWSSGSNARIALARVDMIFWYPALALALVGVCFAWRRRGALLFPLLVGGGSALVSALSQGNFGTAYRHRGEFVWVVAVLAVVGASSLVTRYRARGTLPLET